MRVRDEREGARSGFDATEHNEVRDGKPIV